MSGGGAAWRRPTAAVRRRRRPSTAKSRSAPRAVRATPRASARSPGRAAATARWHRPARGTKRRARPPDPPVASASIPPHRRRPGVLRGHRETAVAGASLEPSQKEPRPAGRPLEPSATLLSATLPLVVMRPATRPGRRRRPQAVARPEPPERTRIARQHGRHDPPLRPPLRRPTRRPGPPRAARRIPGIPRARREESCGRTSRPSARTGGSQRGSTIAASWTTHPGEREGSDQPPDRQSNFPGVSGLQRPTGSGSTTSSGAADGSSGFRSKWATPGA